MEYRTLSQICGRLYFLIFLFRVGLFTLYICTYKYIYIFIASFKALAILCPSLPIIMILKLSTVVMWQVGHWCSNRDESAFKCSFYLSPNLLDDSPIYSSSHSILSHLNQYMTLFFLAIVSLQFGDISR